MRKLTLIAIVCLQILLLNLAFADIAIPEQNNTHPSPSPVPPSQPNEPVLVLIGAALIIIAVVAWLLVKKFLGKGAKKPKSRR